MIFSILIHITFYHIIAYKSCLKKQYTISICFIFVLIHLPLYHNIPYLLECTLVYAIVLK